MLSERVLVCVYCGCCCLANFVFRLRFHILFCCATAKICDAVEFIMIIFFQLRKFIYMCIPHTDTWSSFQWKIIRSRVAFSIYRIVCASNTATIESVTKNSIHHSFTIVPLKFQIVWNNISFGISSIECTRSAFVYICSPNNISYANQHNIG